MSQAPLDIEMSDLGARVGGLPGVARVREAARGEKAYLVGGAVRDLLLGRERADVDIVIEGDAIAIAHRLGGELVVHERFGTASVLLGEASVDLAGARAESYPAPGALPDVRRGDLADDLARRDFTINAMAVALGEPGELIDPHDGARDLAAGRLRVLHSRSFEDDPTRALRAARYAARLGLEPEPRTAELLARADLATVSAQRVEAELRRLAAERHAVAGLELAAAWGLLELRADDRELLARSHALLGAPRWAGIASFADVAAQVLAGKGGRALALAALAPERPSEAVEAAHGHGGVDLLLARALGAQWLERYVDEWRHVRLEIAGDDLLEAGIPQGPAVGQGLRAALRAKLDGGASGRAEELRTALAAVKAG